MCATKGDSGVRKGAIAVAFCVCLIWAAAAAACTVIVAGRDATVDGAVIASQTVDGRYDSNLRRVPGKRHEPGERASVYLNLLGEDDREPLKVGEIPQAEETYGYFRTAYSSFNEHQLVLAESTIGQKDELKAFYCESGAIMTIEQLSIFALQRTRTAREAIRLMGELAERYGFLGSCANEGEALAVADPQEVWIFEIMSVGYDWTPEMGRPGAIWAARRVPDGHVAVLANASRIGVIHPDGDENVMVSSAYMEPALRFGWYDPSSGKPFNWTEAYSPASGAWSPSSMWVRGRVHAIYRELAPSKKWDPYGELGSYPFSFKPERLVSVQDVMDLFRSTLEGTPFAMEEDRAWLVPGDNGESVKSELATPFPDRATRTLLNIPYARPVAARTSWSFISQSRSWLPDAVGGVFWVGLGLPHFTCYVPVYAGVADIAESWRNFQTDLFDERSTRWCVNLAADLVNDRYQRAIRDLRAFRDPLELRFLEDQPEIERTALHLREVSEEDCSRYLTEKTRERMETVHAGYWRLCRELIARYTGNKLW